MAAISKQVGGGNSGDQTYTRPFALPPEWYYDPAIYRREAESIFYGTWRLAGHRSELARPGDFVTVDFCNESLLVVRGRDASLRGFYNVCQHRGHRLVSARRGNVDNTITCPYHAWAYQLDGALRGAPNCDEVPGFDNRRVRLSAVKVEEHGGFVWVNTDLDAAPVEHFFPGLAEAFASYLPDRDSAVFFEGDFAELTFNWKAAVDNSLDTYHFPHSGPAHRELLNSMRSGKFIREVHESWLVSHSFPGDPDTSGYRFDPSRSRGEVDGLAIFWIYPDQIINSLPMTRTFFIYNTPPRGPESTALEYMYYGHPSVRDLQTTHDAIDWINRSVGGEDNQQIANVHAGNKSRGFTGAHFMVDAQHSRLSEHPGADFHRRIYEAVTGELA